MAQGRASGASAPAKPKSAAARWRDFWPRLASAMALAPIALGAVWYGGLVWQVLLTLLAMVAVLEWAGLCGFKLDSQLALAAATSIAVAQTAFMATGQEWAPAALVALIGAVVATRHRLLGAGVLYVGAGYLALLLLRQGPGGLPDLLFVVLVVWANDVGAYLAGRLIGGRRMAPKLSPGKTWAGAGGGMVASIGMGLGVAVWAGAGTAGQFRAEGLAVAVSISAQIGDLLESALKRRTGAKDSGQLIPGHGGLLDRVDGLLAAASVALVWQIAWHAIWRGTTLWQ